MVLRARGRQQISLIRPDVANTAKPLDKNNIDRQKVAELKPGIDLERTVQDLQDQLEELRGTAKESRRANIGDIEDAIEFTVKEEDPDKTIRIPHKLGRKPKGLLVLFRSEPTAFLGPTNKHGWGDANTLFFRADAPEGTVFRVLPL